MNRLVSLVLFVIGLAIGVGTAIAVPIDGRPALSALTVGYPPGDAATVATLPDAGAKISTYTQTNDIAGASSRTYPGAYALMPTIFGAIATSRAAAYHQRE